MQADAADTQGQVDLIIVGGGVTGAALAYMACRARPGLRVLLLEGGALASGTSGRSSRFLHGGFRYLAQGRVGLVRRLLEGRAELAALAPHLVRPAPFLLPFGPATPHPAWMLRAALGVYAALERYAPPVPNLPRPEHLDAAAAARAEPLLAGVPVDGALAYGELIVDDAGLVRALAAGAQALGAVVRTHVRCEALLRDGDRVIGVRARDLGTQESFAVRARAVVDATGPWRGCTDDQAAGAAARLRLARGTHLVLPASALPVRRTVVFFAGDGRALFASPRGQQVLVGTTDVAHDGAPDDVAPSDAELAYLLDAVSAAFPAAAITHATPYTAYAGVRLLALSSHDDGRAATGALDRDYRVTWDAPGLLAVRGGKLTLALDGARRALAALQQAGETLGLPALETPKVGTLRDTLPHEDHMNNHAPGRAA